MLDKFTRRVFFLIALRILFSIYLFTSPSAISVLVDFSDKFSEKFYIFSKTSGHLVVEPLQFDFGSVKENEIVRGKFKLMNTGRGILKILNVVPGCGCTTAGMKRDVLKPGDMTEMEFTVDTHDREGYFNSGIEIKSTDTNNPVTVLSITGWIGRGVKIVPPGGYLGVIRAGEKLEGSIQVQFGGLEDFSVKSVKVKNGLVKVNEIRKKDDHTIELYGTINVERVREKRDYSETLIIYTTSKEYPVLQVTYSWTVVPGDNTKE
jgi:hypothetical protein